MNTIKRITIEQAISNALLYAGIENDEFQCLSSSFQDGFFLVNIWTPYLKYVFYVDSITSEVPGIDMEPVPYNEALYFSESKETTPSAAA